MAKMCWIVHILLVFLFISGAYSKGKTTKLVDKCSTDNGRKISAWDWEVRNNKTESYFINFCHNAQNCASGLASVCKKDPKSDKTVNYGSSVSKGKTLPTKPYGKGFSITFNGTKKSNAGCSKNVQTEINFQCDKTLGSPELIDDTGCIVVIEFFTIEACPGDHKISEIPCVIYNPVDKRKRDLSPLTKLKGGHRVSTDARGKEIYINVCRDITFNAKVPDNACSGGSSRAVCRVDLKKSIGGVTKDTKLYYEGDGIKLVYNTSEKTKECPYGVSTEITFLCQTHFSNGGTGPVLITKLSSQKPCAYEISWRTGHACANNDVITKECKFSNGEVSFDLTKLEKPRKEFSYGVSHGDYDYRIKVCSNGQPCGSDKDGSHTAVCQVKRTSGGSESYSCGNADDRSIRYADGDLTMVYKGGSTCSNNVYRRTIITFRCEPTVDVGAPTFIEEQHCYYFFDWRTRHVCPSRKPGACSVISEGDTYDLSILTKTNSSWLVVNTHAYAKAYSFYINVCDNLASLRYTGCRESAACEVHNGEGRGIGMYKSAPTITSGGLSLTYTGGKCSGFNKTVTTTIKFMCKSKDVESPPELESRSWDGCDYLFSWSTAAACRLQVINGKEDCVLEDSVTGNVYDLSPLGKAKDYFTVRGKTVGEEFYIKMCSKKGLSSSDCGGKGSLIGICQKTGDRSYYVAGKIHDNLYYYDGVLKLQFKKGSQCHKKNNPYRESHITFFCDESAGVGKPVYVREDYCVYNFVWYTKHACPLKTLECVVRDDSNGKEYDLSPLVKTNDTWKATKDGNTYYINICRALHRNSDTFGCPASSSVCLKYSNGTTVGIGEIGDGLKIDNSGLPYLQYQSKQYQTLISFKCNQEGRIGSPQLETDYKKNKFVFTWRTKLACGINPREESGCNDKDSRLSVLKKPMGKEYTMKGPSGGKIILNICQNVKCGDYKNSSACFRPSKGKALSIGKSSQSTIEHGKDVITLTYFGGMWINTPSWARYAKTRINFVCSRNQVEGKPEFLKKDENVYVIEFKTSVVCKAQAIECETSSSDRTKKYNLKPLTLISGNWMAEDTRSHLDYYINVCHEYYPGNLNPQCKGRGGIGACQLDNDHKHAYNMGYVRSGPIVTSRNDVTLRYIGGDKCHDKYQRSTRIQFFCSDVHASPVFMIETKDCEYVFNWKTPSACPLEEYRGQDCIVYDTKYGVYYDLNKLKPVYSQDIEKGVLYKVGFCGKQPDKCGKERGKGFDSCLVEGKTVTTGLTLSDMTYYNNKITIIHKNETFTIYNEISCDTQGKLLSYGGKIKSSSGYRIFWTSKLVCPPVTGEECSLTHGRDLYDLSVLAKEKWNWLARNTVKKYFKEFENYLFYFSVCKPLKQIPGLKNNGSRGVMQDDKGNHYSLGTMINSLSISNGFLTMTYGHGDKIPSVCVDSTTTTIQFVCDDIVPEGAGVGPVVDGFDKERCEFHVTWLTRAACPVRSLQGNSAVPCTAVHPATMKNIDLSALNTASGHEVTDQSGNTYVLNVCGSVNRKAHVGCPENSGICKKLKNEDKWIGVGRVNKTLVYRQGFLYLHYKNGDECEKGRDSETLITFMCDSSAGSNGKPTIERTNDDCKHFVTWKTSLACEAEVDCVAHDGSNFYDLSPLILNDDNYEVEYKGEIYLINLCRSLVRDSRCPANAAVCRPQGENLGHVSTPPKIVSQKEKRTEIKVQLVYENGKCNGGGNTTINFFCDPREDLVKPTIVRRDKCSVTVHWWTSLVCDRQPIPNNNCTFDDPNEQFCFDLKRLGQKPTQPVTIPGGTVHFHVCGNPAKDCRVKGEEKLMSGEACLKEDKSLPTALSRTAITYNGQEVRISYGEDIDLLLYCGKDGNSNHPQYIGKSKTNNGYKYLFNLITPEVCPPRKLPCKVKHGGKEFILAGLRDTGSYRVKDDDNNHYWISICGHVQLNTETKICSSRATVIKIPAQNPGQPQVIAVDTDYSLTYQEQDKNYPIHLQYSSGKIIKGCAKITKVVHKFKCKGVMSPPRFHSFNKDSCEYTFLWETREACAEKRAALRQTGDEWTFYDEKTSGCDLDLTGLKSLIPKNEYVKDCALGNDVKVYSDGDEYELVVNCTFKGKKIAVDVIMRCANDSQPKTNGHSNSYLSLLWETSVVCDDMRTSSCSKSARSVGAKSAAAVIGTLTGIGLLAAILFFVCKPQKREGARLWLRWHIRKYICCKPSYQASYRYQKVKTDEEDGETGFIIEARAGSLFSDSEDDDDDNHNSDDKGDDDDDLLPLDDDLLNLDE